MEENLKNEFQDNICKICENNKCSRNIIYEETGNKLRRIYCPDYVVTLEKITKQRKKELIWKEKDDLKDILMT